MTPMLSHQSKYGIDNPGCISYMPKYLKRLNYEIANKKCVKCPSVSYHRMAGNIILDPRYDYHGIR